MRAVPPVLFEAVERWARRSERLEPSEHRHPRAWLTVGCVPLLWPPLAALIHAFRVVPVKIGRTAGERAVPCRAEITVGVAARTAQRVAHRGERW
eukprot:7386112-Prymnesium_polylepis.2